MSFASSINDLWEYRRTRFPLAKFAPLALYLALAASKVDQPIAVGLALLWLCQFRLADDLADRERDRCDRPGRVLARADVWPFLGLLALLMVGNALLALWLRGPGFLALVGVSLLWYATARRWPPPPLLASAVVLLKYPAFVYLLGDSFDWARVLLVYACFFAYETLHDERLWGTPGVRAYLAAAMLLMVAASVPLAPAVAVGAGGGVLAWLFHRCRRREPGLWPYAVFLVSSGWIACGYRQ